MGLAALLLLLITVLVGFVKKLNVGLLAIAGAVVLGYGSGLFKGSKIISGFSANLFMILLGITLFFGIIQNNGCIELSMRKLVHICGHHVWLIPPLVYGVGFIFAAMGPGCVPAMAFAAAVAIPLAHETGYHPIMLLLLGNLGTYCGRFSPITPEGDLIQEILGNQGIVVPSSVFLLNTFLGTLLLSVLVFLFYKGYQVKAPEKSSKTVDELHFTGAQLVALGSVAVMILLVLKMGMNVGLASFLMATLLILLGIGDEKSAFKSVPWSTLIMVCGVGVLMNLVIATGGINLLAQAISKAMTPSTAGALMGLLAGVMSWFSSAIGVVFPTLLPTVGLVGENLGGTVPLSELVSVVALFASVAGLSPASTGGAVIMGACGIDDEYGKKYPAEKLFLELLLWAIGSIAVLTLLAFLGLFRIFV